MRPILWFAPVGLLTVFAGYMGYRMGQPLNESDVIVHWAQHYVDTVQGAVATDCAARPDARGHVWIVLTCADPRGERDAVVYQIATNGGLVGTTRQDALDTQT